MVTGGLLPVWPTTAFWIPGKTNISEKYVQQHGPITSWEVDGETVETMSDFVFWGSKITADGDCSHEIKRHLPLEAKLWPA